MADLYPYLFLAAGLALLAWGGCVLVDGAVHVAKKMNVSSQPIGLTRVGFGSSTPELLTSLRATMVGSPGIALGNVVGNNIYNALFILGVTALFLPVRIPQDSSRESMYVMVGVTVLLLFLGKVFHKIGRLWGIFFLLLYGVYVTCLLK